MKTLKSRLLAVIATLSFITCLAFCLVACNNNDNTNIPTFPDKHTVTYVTNGGSELESEECISIANSPTTQKEHYVFDGWYTSSDLDSSSRVSFPYTVTEDVTLYAKWVPCEYSANITIHGGGKIVDSNNDAWDAFSFMLAHGSEHTFRAMANNEYIFDGWYKDNTKISSELTLTFTMPAEDEYYTAKFNAVRLLTDTPFTPSNMGEHSFTAVDNIVHLTAKPYLGYEFLGWYELSDEYEATLLSDKQDFEFNGIGHSGTIRSKWDIAPDMKDFVFTSDFDKCVITGVAEREKPSYTIPNYVTAIGENAFQYCVEFSQIDIPDSVTEIGDYAFANIALKSITIGKGLERLGDYALGYGGISSISVSEQNAKFSVYENVLYNKNKTQFVYVPSELEVFKVADGITQIKDFEFSNEDIHGSLNTDHYPYLFQHIELPDSVTEIGYCAFGECASLKSINLGGGITTIGPLAFDGCRFLESISIGAANEGSYQGLTIHRYAFLDCNNIKTIRIDKDVEVIFNNAFTLLNPIDLYISDISSWCTFDAENSLMRDVEHLYIKDELTTRLQIPDSVEKIAYNAFSGCLWMTELIIPDSVTEIGIQAFDNCNNLTDVSIGSGIKKIDHNAFRHNLIDTYDLHIKNLTNWCLADILSNPIEYAENVYFDGQIIQDLVIPNEVTAIGRNAFYGLNSLVSL
ncbi:MAG: leucine-rich repeat protein, partial [Clostridia bacterium]|nr:leucine-rich repeat protein [Clostridia bacterium]